MRIFPALLTIKTFMKKNKLHYVSQLLLLLAFGLSSSSSFAQSQIIPAGNTDVFLDNISTAGRAASLNSASIGYNGGELKVVASGGDPFGAAPPSFIVTDGNTKQQQILPYWSPQPVSIHPDIVIGNDLNNTSNYIVGIIYENAAGCGSGSEIAAGLYYDRWAVYWDGSGAIQDSLLERDTLYTYGDYNPHIAILAEYDNPMPSGPSAGMPTCNRVVLSYSEIACTGFYAQFHIHRSSLNTFPYADTFMNVGGWETVGDVALTQVQDPLTGIVKNVLMVAKCYKVQNGSAPYLSNPGQQYLTYSQYDLTTVNGPATTSAFLDSGQYSLPRLTAINDYNNNNQGIAHWAVASQKRSNIPMGDQAWVFTGPAATINGCTALDASYPYFHDSSTIFNTIDISSGPGLQYTVQYSTINTWLPVPPIKTPPPPRIPVFVAQSITLSGDRADSNYCKVPFTHNNGVGSHTLASAPNTGSSNSLFTCWQYLSDSLFIKSTFAPVSFKTAGIINVGNNAAWKIFPNPANSILTINCAGTLSHNSYTITDMTGRLVASDAILTNNTQLDVRGLSPGIYTVTIYSANNSIQTEKLVRE